MQITMSHMKWTIEHCHLSNFNIIASRFIMNELKSPAVTSYNTPQQLVTDSTKIIFPPKSSGLQNSKNIKQTINRIGQKHDHIPDIPATLAHLTIPPDYCIT
ncbi:hypothetical protein HZS_430 [Henneguya salminicola]|nr:hypothetical protein HZS_430 [Henneguya salminicola]